jgi:hypothetical protein
MKIDTPLKACMLRSKLFVQTRWTLTLHAFGLVAWEGKCRDGVERKYW